MASIHKEDTMTDKEAWHRNYNYPDSIEYIGEEEELADLRNDPSMQGLLKYNYADPDATGVAHDNIDGILAGNRQDKLEKLVEREGSISALPYLETEEGQQTLMDIAMGSAGAGPAIGRISKAAITGGKSARSIKQLLEDINTRYGMRPIPGKPGAVYGRFHGQRIDNSHRLIDVAEKKLISWNNKLNAARLKIMKAYEKHDIPFQPFHFDPTHPQYKPQTAEDIVDNVTLLLNKIKRN